MPRLALYALVVCLLATAAAVVSFVRGETWLGVVWVLLAGLSSNTAWYYQRRAKAAGRVGDRVGDRAGADSRAN